MPQADGEGWTGPTRSGSDAAAGRTVSIAVIFALFWLILSGKIGIPYFTMMAISIGIVLAINPDRPFPHGLFGDEGGVTGRIRATWNLVQYVAWLMYNIVKANVEVAYLVLHPRMPIRPRLLRFRTHIQDSVAQVLVANSITLTPGTITIELEDGEYVVHALHPRSAANIVNGTLQNVVARAFQEPPEPPPEMEWFHSVEELNS